MMIPCKGVGLKQLHDIAGRYSLMQESPSEDGTLLFPQAVHWVCPDSLTVQLVQSVTTFAQSAKQ